MNMNKDVYVLKYDKYNFCYFDIELTNGIDYLPNGTRIQLNFNDIKGFKNKTLHLVLIDDIFIINIIICIFDCFNVCIVAIIYNKSYTSFKTISKENIINLY
jgi:hypothetical protein